MRTVPPFARDSITLTTTHTRNNDVCGKTFWNRQLTTEFQDDGGGGGDGTNGSRKADCRRRLSYTKPNCYNWLTDDDQVAHRL
jgi:hypothetical protein